MADLYAILHKPSGKLLPVPRSGSGRGGTYVSVGDPQPPRLFTSKTGATNALKWWLGGPVQTDWEREILGQKHDPRRIAEDMEVVPVTVAVPAQLQPTGMEIFP